MNTLQAVEIIRASVASVASVASSRSYSKNSIDAGFLLYHCAAACIFCDAALEACLDVEIEQSVQIQIDIMKSCGEFTAQGQREIASASHQAAKLLQSKQY